MTIVHVQTIDCPDSFTAAYAFAAAAAAFGGAAPTFMIQHLDTLAPANTDAIAPLALAARANTDAATFAAEHEGSGPAPAEIETARQSYESMSGKWIEDTDGTGTRTVLTYGSGRSVVRWVVDLWHDGPNHKIEVGIRAPSIDSERGPRITSIRDWGSALASCETRIHAARETFETKDAKPFTA